MASATPSFRLHRACRAGRLAEVRVLVRDPGIDLNCREPRRGRTALMVACVGGHTSVVAFLVGLQGLDPNARSSNGSTALHLACRSKRPKIVRLLLDHPDLDGNLADECHQTALHAAMQTSTDAIACMLIASGRVSIRGIDICRNTPLHMACQYSRTRAVQWLLCHPLVNPNARNGFGRTPLMCACQEAALSTIRMMTSHPGVNINATEDGSTTALFMACQGGWLDELLVLLATGRADGTVRARYHGTGPLLTCAEVARLPILAQFRLKRPFGEVVLWMEDLQQGRRMWRQHGLAYETAHFLALCIFVVDAFLEFDTIPHRPSSGGGLEKKT